MRRSCSPVHCTERDSAGEPNVLTRGELRIERIGHFLVQARQLTPQARGRARNIRLGKGAERVLRAVSFWA